MDDPDDPQTIIAIGLPAASSGSRVRRRRPRGLRLDDMILGNDVRNVVPRRDTEHTIAEDDENVR